MDIPLEIRLQSIQPQSAYLDKKSEEKSTGIIKRKYKLLARRLIELDLYIFFISTTTKDACHLPLTLTVTPSDWEDVLQEFFNRTSYFYVLNSEALKEKELSNKIEDKENKFTYIAKLSNNKFIELQKVLKRVGTTRKFIPEKERVLLQIASGEVFEDGEEKTIKERLKKLGL